MRKLIGAGEMPAFLPVLLSVSLTISSRILLKSWNFCPGMCRNSPHSSTLDSLSVVSTFSASPCSPLDWGLGVAVRLISWRMSGLRVTMPVPRGRLCLTSQYTYIYPSVYFLPAQQVKSTYKSLPTMFSNTELLPLDCDPTTAICGKSIGF